MSDVTEEAVRLMDIGEVAGVLKLSTRAVWRLRDSGDLPSPVRIGRNVRRRSDAIQAYIRRLGENDSER